MSARLRVEVGGCIGLGVCGVILCLLWFGVSRVLGVGHTDLMYVLWPSSVILVGRVAQTFEF